MKIQFSFRHSTGEQQAQTNRKMFAPIKALVAVAFLINSSSAWMIINCRFEVSNWSVVGNVYTCRGTIQVTGEGNPVVSVTGTHQSGRSNNDVRGLIIDNQLEDFPENILNFLPGLTALQFLNGNISTLTEAVLRPYTALRVLGLAGNKLTHLEGDLLHANRALEWVSFSGNEIRTIERGLLSALPSLTSAFFAENDCINSSTQNRNTMSEFSRQLSTACPVTFCPPGVTPPAPTTQVPDTTTISSGDCGCSNEIEALRREFNAGYFELRGRVAVQDERLTEVERRVREIDSNPAPFEM
jgi:hypothetical protein